MGSMWSTKYYDNNSNSKANVCTNSDCLRTTLADNDFNKTSDCRFKLSEDNHDFQVNTSNSCCSTFSLEKPIMSDCHVILEDIFPNDQTGKLKVLNGSLDKTHSASSHQSKDKIHLESVVKKEPISWPLMKDSDLWSQLDDAVSLCLVGGSSVNESCSARNISVFKSSSNLWSFTTSKERPSRFK